MLWLEIPAYAGSTISWSSQPPRRRIIPAYAGSTSRAVASCRRSWDHPRIRGEHRPKTSMPFNSLGSSPHTRGAHGDSPVGAGRSRIIPAYAGSTMVVVSSTGRRRDHPRLAAIALICLGSSPHTRGARAPAWCISRRSRIIPAYAGSTPE